MNVHRGKKGTHKEMLQSAGRNMDGWLHLCSYIINTHNSLGSTKEGRPPKIVLPRCEKIWTITNMPPNATRIEFSC